MEFKINECELDTDYVSFDSKNNCYKVYRTKKTYEYGNCLGFIRFVVDENKNPLHYFVPLFNYSGGYSLVSVGLLNEYKFKIKQYKKISAKK